MTLICPTCDTVLTQRSIGSQTIDKCVNCNGAWYDSSELSAILRNAGEHHWSDQPDVDPPGAIKCPECETNIVSSIYAHDSAIPILKCSMCKGVWLTSGQLERIADYRNGPHKTDRLGRAMAGNYADSSQRNQFVRLVQSRLLSLIFVIMLLILTAFLGGGGKGVLQLLALLLLPLACIWFSDSMGSLTGTRFGLGRPAITQSTPGVVVAIGGWLLMLTIFGVMILLQR